MARTPGIQNLPPEREYAAYLKRNEYGIPINQGNMLC